MKFVTPLLLIAALSLLGIIGAKTFSVGSPALAFTLAGLGAIALVAAFLVTRFAPR